MFQNPKKALLFVGMTMFSVVMLVGSEDDQGALIQATESLEQPERRVFEQPAIERNTDERRFDRSEPDDSGWFSDDELIDDTSGFDPSPQSTDPIETNPAEGDLYIIEN